MNEVQSKTRSSREAQNVRIQRVGYGCAARITFQEGDTFIWTRGPGVLSAQGDMPTVLDVWRLQEGETALVTNCVDELPDWFKLTPSERMSMDSLWAIASAVAGAVDTEPMEGPQIWRVLAGDRLVWTGSSRDGEPAGKDWYRFYNFDENALVIGSPAKFCSGFPMFGMPAGEYTRDQVIRGQRALAAIRAMGTPDVISADGMWRL